MMKIRLCSAVVVLVLGLWASSVRGDAPTAEDKLLDVLKSNAAVGDKANACRELKLVGTAKSIPVLAPLLLDAELSHPARYALESMPSSSARAALREALGKATGLPRAGIIDSLGQCGDRLAVPVIAADLTSKDLTLVAAAATALGKIESGTLEASKLLISARRDVSDATRIKIDDGLLICADRLGKMKVAQVGVADEIYTLLSRPSEPRRIQLAARRGQMRIAGPRAAAVIARSLADGDPLVRKAAAAELSSLSDAELGSISGSLSELPAESQTAVLAAIRIHGSGLTLPAVLAATKSPHESVCLAAAQALSTVGDVTALPALTELAAAEGQLGQTARQTLEAICGPKIDEQIFTALRAEKDPTRRAAWIVVVQARRPAGAVSLLLGEAGQQEPLVATCALAALAKLAPPSDISALVTVLLKTEKGPVRDEAERAVRAVCLQIPDVGKRAQPVLATYRVASPADRLVLLPLLGRIGGDEARSLIHAALGSKDSAVYEAGMRAISNWPSAEVADQLLRLAQTCELPVHRQWALYAFVRVVSLPGGTSNAEKLARLKQAMQLSRTDHERRWVIERAAAVRAVETLRFLVPYIGQPVFGEQACRSVVELAHHKELRDPNRQEFAAALKNVLATAKDTITRERAKRYIEAQ
jgi:HEAT repeat protein